VGKSIQENEVYENVKVLKYTHKNKHGKKIYSCKCLLCGNEFSSMGTLIKNGRIKSCGCIRKTNAGNLNKSHGMTHTRIYKIWKGMRNRCNNPNYHSYHRYGGRGIRVCDRWEEFENFYKDMSKEYFDTAEIDRVNNNKDYSPDNCRWVSHKENSNNRSKYNSNSDYTGVFKTKKYGTYQVNLSHNRKVIYIGSYKTLKEAVNARKEFIIDFNKKNNTNYKYEEFQE
jgi:hypothetical protein